MFGLKKKVPVIMQMEAVECGAASLSMVLAYHGRWLPLEKLRSDCGVSRDGSNALNLLKAARLHGMKAKGYRYEPEELRDMPKPAILHWDFNHFVVLSSFKKNKVIINDPARGVIKIGVEELDKSFTGVALGFEKGENFVKGGRPSSIISFIKNRLKNAKEALFFTLFSGLLAAIVSVALPVFSQVFSDNIITGRNSEWFTGFIWLFGGLVLFQFIIQCIQGIYDQRLRGRLAIEANSNFFWHVLRLPVHFFSQRYVGDLVSRQMSNEEIPDTLVKQLAPVLVNMLLLLLYLFFMIRYSIPLALIAIFSTIINLYVIQAISEKQINLSRVVERNLGKLMGVTMSSLQSIETIKAAGAEDGFFQRWAGHFATSSNSQIKSNKTNTYLGVIPQLLVSVSNNVVLMLGAYLILKGELTIGMLMAFQGFMGAFMFPMGNLMQTYQGLLTMRTQMERVDDVYRTKCDVASELEDTNDSGAGKLGGLVELKNVTFGYNILSAPLLKDFSLKLEPGKSVAFVGSSGCGKSTIAKLVSGLYAPWSGEILFDGKSQSEINHSVFVNSVSVVDQDIVLFDGTVTDNIKMWDQSIEDFAMIMASNNAQIHEEIASRPHAYDSHIENGGKNFSGGQKQRLEIAAAMAKDPVILILDEATSALDAATEEKVMNAIKLAGVSLIIIAHRLSTIRDCDEIIVMDKGSVLERGTHEQLLENKGFYSRLMNDN